MANEIKKINVAGVDYAVVDTDGRKEAYLEWGGKNLRGTYGPVDAAMVPDLGANRFAFLNNIANSVTIEYSRDGGSTWTDYGATADQKSNLFNGNGSSFIIGKPDSGTVASNQYQLRVSILTSNDMGCTYTTLNKFIAYVSTSGTSNNWVTIRGRKQSDYEAGTDTWTVFATKVPVDGWSGYNVINTTGITTYGNTKTAQYGQLQFIFGCDTGSTSAYQGLNVQKIFAYGGMGWTPPSNMAKNGHMYTFDASQNVTFPAKVTATQIIKSGGTAAQFLKANGTVDSNVYVHTAGTGLTKSGNTLSANIEDSVTSTATNKMLSAKQGKVLNDKISAIEGRGRYLSIWDASTGKPNDLPGGGSSTTEVYTYKSGDYFIVKTAGNKVPSGTSIPAGTTIATFPSTTGDSSQINDSIYFNGTSWAVLHTPAGSGDVTGPAAAGADGNIAVFNGTTGKIIKDSGVNISNVVKTSGNQNIAGSKTFTDKITAQSGIDFNVNGHEITVDSNDDLVVAAGQDNLILGDPTYGDGQVYIVSATEGNQVVKKSEVPVESTVSSWGFTKNTGTVTSVAVKMNGSTKGTVTTSGTIDLGTVITAHQDVSGKANDNAVVHKTGDETVSGSKTFSSTQYFEDYITFDTTNGEGHLGIVSGGHFQIASGTGDLYLVGDSDVKLIGSTIKTENNFKFYTGAEDVKKGVIFGTNDGSGNVDYGSLSAYYHGANSLGIVQLSSNDQLDLNAGSSTGWSNSHMVTTSKDFTIHVKDTYAGTTATGGHDCKIKIEPGGSYGPTISVMDGSSAGTLNFESYCVFLAGIWADYISTSDCHNYAHNIRVYYGSTTKCCFSLILFRPISATISTVGSLATQLYYNGHTSAATACTASGWCNGSLSYQVVGAYATSTSGPVYVSYMASGGTSPITVSVNTSATVSDKVIKVI